MTHVSKFFVTTDRVSDISSNVYEIICIEKVEEVVFESDSYTPSDLFDVSKTILIT